MTQRIFLNFGNCLLFLLYSIEVDLKPLPLHMISHAWFKIFSIDYIYFMYWMFIKNAWSILFTRRLSCIKCWTRNSCSCFFLSLWWRFYSNNDTPNKNQIAINKVIPDKFNKFIGTLNKFFLPVPLLKSSLWIHTAAITWSNTDLKSF